MRPKMRKNELSIAAFFRKGNDGRKLLFYAFVLSLYLMMMFAARDVYPANGDAIYYYLPWWNYLVNTGYHGILTIEDTLGANVMPTWYFIMVILAKVHVYPDFPIQYCIKTMAVSFTVVASVATLFIVRYLVPKDSWKPAIGAGLMLFIPAFVLDTFKTNMPDSLYLSLCVLSLLAFIKRQHWLAWLIVGIAFASKSMAIYIIPFYLFFWLRDFRTAPWLRRTAPLFAAVGFMLCSIPNMLIGMSFYDAVFGVVFSRIGDFREEGFLRIMNATNGSRWYPFITSEQGSNMSLFGYAAIILVFTALFMLLLNIKNRAKQNESAAVLLIVSPLVFWLFMPAQREGYFALATVFATLIFLLRPDRASLIVFVILSFCMWQAYHMWTWLIGADGYVYVIMAIVAYLLLRVFRISGVGQHFWTEKLIRREPRQDEVLEGNHAK